MKSNYSVCIVFDSNAAGCYGWRSTTIECQTLELAETVFAEQCQDKHNRKVMLEVWNWEKPHWHKERCTVTKRYNRPKRKK